MQAWGSAPVGGTTKTIKYTQLKLSKGSQITQPAANQESTSQWKEVLVLVEFNLYSSDEANDIDSVSYSGGSDTRSV